MQITKIIEFTGHNYNEIFKECPTASVRFPDGLIMPLSKWVIELGGFSPFDENPECIIINHIDITYPFIEYLYRHDLLVFRQESPEPIVFTCDNLKTLWGQFNAATTPDKTK